jgi:hypothetical protein
VLTPCFVSMLGSFTVMIGSPEERRQVILHCQEKLNQMNLEIQGKRMGAGGVWGLPTKGGAAVSINY